MLNVQTATKHALSSHVSPYQFPLQLLHSLHAFINKQSHDVQKARRQSGVAEQSKRLHILHTQWQLEKRWSTAWQPCGLGLQ